MKMHHSLICLFFFLSLQDGNTGLVNAQIPVYSGTEGEDVRIHFSFSFGGKRKCFCKETCRENVLIDTTGVRAQRGRYIIEYEETSRGADVFVTIRNLTKSDSGRYGCGLGEPGKSPYKHVEIIVVDAVLERNPPEEKTLYTRPGGNIVVQCVFYRGGTRMYFCRDDCKGKDVLVQTTGDKVQNSRYSIEFIKEDTTKSVYVSITQLKQSDSGRYSCTLDRPSSPDLYHEFSINVTDGPPLNLRASTSVSTPTTSSSVEQETEPTPTTAVLLYLVVTLVIVVIILGLALTIICVQRKSKPEGLITRENNNNTNMEIADYENTVSVSEDVTYLTLHPATRDLNQTYSTLTHTQHT